MTLTELLSVLTPRQNLAVAIGLSIALYALASNIILAETQIHSSRLRHMVAWSRTAWLARSAKEVARWLYYLGVPYLTLMLGWTTARSLGVWNLDWLTPLFDAVVLGAGSLLVFIWIWQPYARTEHPHAVDESRWNAARHVVELLYQQAHWALYRSGPILWVADVYLGSFLGLLLTLIEAWSSPRVRSSVHDTTRADSPLWTGSLAVAATVVFIFTQNVWYCVAIHVLLDLGLRPAIGFPRVAPDRDLAPPFETETDLGN